MMQYEPQRLSFAAAADPMSQLATANPNTRAIVEWLSDELATNPELFRARLNQLIGQNQRIDAWDLGSQAYLEALDYGVFSAPPVTTRQIDWEFIGHWVHHSLELHVALDMQIDAYDIDLDSHDLTYIDSHDTVYQDYSSHSLMVVNHHYYPDAAMNQQQGGCGGCSGDRVAVHFHAGDRAVSEPERKGNLIDFYLGVLVILLIMAIVGARDLFYYGTDLFPLPRQEVNAP